MQFETVQSQIRKCGLMVQDCVTFAWSQIPPSGQEIHLNSSEKVKEITGIFANMIKKFISAITLTC